MEQETAIHVANAWNDAGGREFSANAYGTLQRGLQELVPEPNAWAAATVSGKPTALILVDAGLILPSVRAAMSRPSSKSAVSHSRRRVVRSSSPSSTSRSRDGLELGYADGPSSETA